MPDQLKDPSMFITMDRVVKQVEKQDDILEEHTLQLRIQAEQILQLQDNTKRLETVVMAENRETRMLVSQTNDKMSQTNDKLHELINGLMGYNTGNNKLATSLKMARMESIAKIVGILAGSGGILYYIFGQ